MASITEHTARPEAVPYEERPPSTGGHPSTANVSLGGGGKSAAAAAGGTAGHPGPGQGGGQGGGNSGK